MSETSENIERRIPAELWIIEAPGKANMLEAMLARVGIDARVQATKGHFVQMPKATIPMGIDRTMHDFAREPTDPVLYERIRRMAREARRVVVATDGDMEGEVIAWDVAVAIADIHPAPVRVRLRGIDDESILEAVAAAGPVTREAAVPGRTRAIVDRLIGGVFSGRGVKVGRINTAMLGVVSSGAPTVWRLALAAPAKDGGRPWTANVDVKTPLSMDVAERLSKVRFPPLGAASSESRTTAPAHTGEIMIRASEKLGLTPSETARAMQNTYETGRLSYPRAGSKGMSRSAARKIKEMMRKAGVRFEEEALAAKPDKEPHDAPHPIGPVDVSLDPRKLGADDGVRAMIARDLVRSGQRHTVETPGAEKLEPFLIGEGFSREVASLVSKLPWRREVGPRYPGQESWPKSGIVRRPAEAVLLEAMIETGLGRPSTWANHVDGFIGNGVVTDELALTEKGRRWIEGSPESLLDPRISVALEAAFERVPKDGTYDPDREPWEVLADKIVAVLPEDLSGPLRNAVAPEGPRERRDFRETIEPGFDFGNEGLVNVPTFTPD